MKRPLMIAVFATLLAVASGGCTACPTGKLTELLQQNPKPKAELAALATTARTDAAKQSDPKNKVSCYRVAAIAAWQSEADDAPVEPIVTAGIAACETLPKQDADAPTDCTLIRVALPMATQDTEYRRLQTFRATMPTVTSKLPIADLTPLQKAFDDLLGQFDTVSEVQTRANNLAVPDEVKGRLARYRVIIACNAVTAWSLSGRCTAGATEAQLSAMNAEWNEMGIKKDQLIQRLGMTPDELTDACEREPAISADVK